MRAAFVATSGFDYTLCIFPNYATTWASGAGAKSIPDGTTSTLPVRFTIRLPFTFWTANMYIIHAVKLVIKKNKNTINT